MGETRSLDHLRQLQSGCLREPEAVLWLGVTQAEFAKLKLRHVRITRTCIRYDIRDLREVTRKDIERARQPVMAPEPFKEAASVELPRAACGHPVGTVLMAGLRVVSGVEKAGRFPLIYALLDPADTAAIRYVGRSVNHFERYRSHAFGSSSALRSWVRSLRRAKRWPLMILLERCSGENIDERETAWIAHYRKQGQADLNTIITKYVKAAM